MSARWSAVRTPKDDCRVSVVRHDGVIVYDRVFIRGNGRRRDAISIMLQVPLIREDYGITWVHRWGGRNVDLLKVSAALAAR